MWMWRGSIHCRYPSWWLSLGISSHPVWQPLPLVTCSVIPLSLGLGVLCLHDSTLLPGHYTVLSSGVTKLTRKLFQVVFCSKCLGPLPLTLWLVGGPGTTRYSGFHSRVPMTRILGVLSLSPYCCFPPSYPTSLPSYLSLGLPQELPPLSVVTSLFLASSQIP